MSNQGRSLHQPPRTEASELLSRRVLITAAAGLAAGGSAVGFGWLAAMPRRRLPHEAADQPVTTPWIDSAAADLPRLEVTGASMAPTLVGRHVHVRCGGCGMAWAAYGSFEHGGPTSVICWNCGVQVALDRSITCAGTMVQLTPAAADVSSFAAGELVAIYWPADEFRVTEGPDSSSTGASGADAASRPDLPPSLSVKRIVAGPGQMVDHREGQLLIDDEPVLPEQTWLPVHDDRHRNAGVSWWKPQCDGRSRSIQSTADGFHLCAASGEVDASVVTSDWLVYHHRSVHNGMRPDCVRDDVPGNVNEVRALLPVSRLRLSFRVVTTVPAALEVAFWNGTLAVVRRIALSAGATELDTKGPRLRRPEPLTAADTEFQLPRVAIPELGDPRPLAMRMVAGSAKITQLRIERPLVYRIDPRLAATIDWPVRLGTDQYYLLGDNVPLSIDSRHFGPVARTRIVGRIQPVRYDELHR